MGKNEDMPFTPTQTEEPQADELLQWCSIRLDPLRYQASVDGRLLELTLVEFNLLACLMRNPRRVLSRQQLLEDVWNNSSDATTRTVDTHIYRLRRKLGPNSRCIRTVRGLGYALDG